MWSFVGPVIVVSLVTVVCCFKLVSRVRYESKQDQGQTGVADGPSSWISAIEEQRIPPLKVVYLAVTLP